MRQLILEGRITVFENLFEVFLVFYKSLNSITLQLTFCIKYRKTLFGKGKRQKLNTVFFAMAMKMEV